MAYGSTGESGRALAAVAEGLRILEALPEERWVRDYLLAKKVLGLWAAGEFDEAHELGRAVLPSAVEQGGMICIGSLTEYLAWIMCAKNEHRVAAVLLGAAGEIWRTVVPLLLGDPELIGRHSETESALLAALGGERFTRAYARGTRLSLDELVDLVAGNGTRASGTRGAAGEDSLGALTPREREVAHLLAEGLSNRQIAERLVISKRTADAHVEHILSELGFNSRTQVAAMIGAGTKT